jgi:hypothetical protein
MARRLTLPICRIRNLKSRVSFPLSFFLFLFYGFLNRVSQSVSQSINPIQLSVERMNRVSLRDMDNKN